jgi:hypothetical protein
MGYVEHCQKTQIQAMCSRPISKNITTTCSNCGEPLQENRIGKQRYCLYCHNAHMRKIRPKHSELTEAQRLKANARAYLNVYVKRGQVVKQPCCVCGSEKSQAHHDDYSKPLEVRWYCRLHHNEFHQQNSPSSTKPAKEKSMKKASIILALLIITFAAQSQTGTLGCDSSTRKRDTLTGYFTYIDTATKKLYVAEKGIVVSVTCRLMYYGSAGAPNAPTDQKGVEKELYYVGNREISADQIIKFTKAKPTK